MSSDLSQSSCQSVKRVEGEKHALVVKTKATLQYFSPCLGVWAHRQLNPWHPDSVPGFIRPWAVTELGYSWRRSSTLCTWGALFGLKQEMYSHHYHTDNSLFLSSLLMPPIKSLSSIECRRWQEDTQLNLISVSCVMGTKWQCNICLFIGGINKSANWNSPKGC